MWVNELFTEVCGPLCILLICLNQIFQERNWAFPSTLETRVLCEAGYESYPYRPTNDLHTSPHVYGHLHEKVRAEMRVYWQYDLQNSSKMQEHVRFLDIHTQAIGAVSLEFTNFFWLCVTCLGSSIKLRSCVLCILILPFWCLPFSLDSYFSQQTFIL